MKKSMLIIPSALLGMGIAAYFMFNKKGQNKADKMISDFKNSMDEMMSE